MHVTGWVYLAGPHMYRPGIECALSDCTNDVASVAPDSCLVVTTCDSDSSCFTHSGTISHGYPGCESFETIRECIDCVDVSVVVACGRDCWRLVS